MIVADEVIIGVIAAAAAAIVGPIVVYARRVIRAVSNLPDQLAANHKLIRHVLVTQGVVMECLTVSLKCQSNQECNGDVEDALRMMAKAKRRARNFAAGIMTDENFDTEQDRADDEL